MAILQQFIPMSMIFKLSTIVITFVIAWIFHRLSWRIASLILLLHNFTFPASFLKTAATSAKKDGHRERKGLISGLDHVVKAEAVSKQWSKLNKWLPDEFKTTHQMRQKRRETLQELLANAVSLLAFIIAILVSLSQFAHQDTVIWVAGLFGSALAFAGRTFIGDFLAGIAIIFQDKFDVGEAILIKAQLETIEGVVEHVSLNATWVRARTGELYVISNGEMRFICNFSRGLHSSANITIKIAATDLDRALPLLKNLGQEVVNLLPGLRESWQVVSETGTMGQNVELTLITKAEFGQAANLRPQLLTLIQERLNLANILLTD